MSGPKVHLRVDGRDVPARAGESVAVALVRSGRWVFGRSVKYHRPRGPVCFRGRCDGCLMRVDGVANLMTCLVPATDGLEVETQNVLGTAGVDLLALTDWVFPEGMDHHHMFTRFKPTNAIMQKIARRVAGVGKLPSRVVETRAPRELDVDVLVIGGGEDGVRAANAAARQGASVALVEEGPRLRDALAPGPPIDVRLGTAAFAVHHEIGAGFAGREEASEPVRWVLLQDAHGLVRVRPRALIVATGVAEGAVAFAGNDLPGVVDAHAAHSLHDAGIDLGAVVVVGEPAVARALEAKVIRVVRQIDIAEVASLEARGRAEVRKMIIGDETVACDLVVMAAPPSARYELASQAGAEIRWHEGAFAVVADDAGRAGDALYAIGSCTGRLGDAAAAQAERAGALAGGGRE